MSGWIEAFPTTNKRAQTVSIFFSEKFSPSLESQLLFCQTMAQSLPPRSLKLYLRLLTFPDIFISHTILTLNRSLKSFLVKMSQELYPGCIILSPLAFLRLRALPKSPLSISPFELMYGLLVFLFCFSRQGFFVALEPVLKLALVD